MSFLNKIFGRPLASWELKRETLTVLSGVPALGLDAFASIAYGPEALLLVLLPLGTTSLYYYPYISIAVVAVLIILYLSYQQTIAAYPNGGGAYVVASDNLGKRAGLWAAVSLLLDYLLNVAVGIAAGIGAVVSAVPALQPYTLILCLLVLLSLTLINLRGVRESGFLFIVPIILFVLCLAATVLIGIYNTHISGGHPHEVISPPFIPPATSTVSTWLLLTAFANGLTAMTGIEAVSNAVPLFRKPAVRNAHWTMTIIVAILASFLLALAYLGPIYHIKAMDETLPGYQTLLSQIIEAIAGRGTFYYISICSIFIVLTYSAQTSFVGFPRVCRLLSEDGFLPHFFANLGRRLVYSHGIIALAILSAFLLIIFGGNTFKLIPLFAVGAFSAFTFSQTGMVFYWLRKKDRGFNIKLFFNALGAITTGIALVIIIAAKFIEGAWITIVIGLIFVTLFAQIRKHYQKINREISHPLKLQVNKLQPPVVIIPIDGWTCVTEKAVEFGLLISDDITALYINAEENKEIETLKTLWAEKVEKPAKAAKTAIPILKIINSPYRRIYQPILDFVNKTKKEKPDRLIAVIISELVEPHWYEYLLHNIHGAGLRALLFLERDQRTVVISTPWYLRD